MKNRIMALVLSIAMVCSLLIVPATAEENTVLDEAGTEIVFDISQGSVIADGNGITGYKSGETKATTILWNQVTGSTFVVTGTSDSGSCIKLDSSCPQDVTLTLRSASITAASGADAPIHNLSEKALTVLLEGENSLQAVSGRVLWTAGSGVGMHFIGQGGKDKASLKLTGENSAYSLMVSKSKDGSDTGGTFMFENCAVTMNRAFAPGKNAAASSGTNVHLAAGAVVTDGDNKMYSNENLTLNIADGDITLGKEYQVKGSTWTLTYDDPTYTVTGGSEDNPSSNRVTVTDPGVQVTLKDLYISTTGRSAFLVKYSDPDDYNRTLMVKVDGQVELSTDSASALNTNDSETKGYNADVKLVGVTGKTDDVVTITRGNDTGTIGSDNKVAVGVDLTVENAAVIIKKNCRFDVTADAGSVVGVAGAIGGSAVEQEGGRLIRGTFDYRFTEDGREFKAVADESNDGLLTLLLPSTANLNAVEIEITGGWTVSQGEMQLASGEKLNFADAENNTLSLTVAPPTEAEELGATAKDVQVRAIKGSEGVPAVYLTLTKNTMADVDADPNHDTKAKGSIEILGEESPENNAMEIKGRGNASWNRDKKGYQIKLDKKFDMLGMGESKKWILLPSSADLSMVRSAVGFHLAQELGMEHAGNWAFVDFYADGEYRGLYILCEKVEVGSNRIDITNIDDVLEDTIGKDKYLSEESGVVYSEDYGTATLENGTVIDLTGGYHLEFDNYADPLQFSAGGIQRITVKEPEYLGENPKSDDSFTYIRNFMNAAGGAVNGEDEAVLRQYIDLESFAQMWLLKQYINDYDATNNMHIWKESSATGDGLLHAGLAWDFDNSMCRDVYNLSQVINTATSGTNFKNTGSAKWLKLLEDHPAFQEELARQYALHKDLFTCCGNCNPASQLAACDNCGECYVHNFAAEQAEKIAQSAKMDTIRWYGTVFATGTPVNSENRASSLNTVKAFACARNTYMAQRMNDLKAALYDVTFVSNGQTVATIPVGRTGLQELPEVTRDGYIFQGWFYSENGSEKEFIPGTAVKGPLTVNAKWTQTAPPVTDPPTDPSGPSSGGSSSETTYLVGREDTKNGSVAVRPSRASSGQTVTITVTPDEGYELDDLTVTDARGNEITVRSKGSNQYTFTMPRSRVTIEATFAEIDKEPGLVFTDVAARDYYYDAVYWAVENGITSGTGAATFSPNAGVTRAQMVTFLWRAAGSPIPTTTANPFTDVDAGDYFYNAVLWAVENGITSGTSATTFGPESAVSRAQAVTFLWRSASSPAASGVSFDDVADEAYYAQAVAWAAQEGITSGTGGNNFGPDLIVSRAQAVTFLYRHMG